LLDEFPERGITVMSSLAEGADQLVAEEALTLGISLIAPLPMPRELYLEDFETPIAREKFNTLLSQASRARSSTRCCRRPPRFLSCRSQRETPRRRSPSTAPTATGNAHCHILLALWDGKESEELGGTGQVVRFHHDDVMPGYISRATTSRLVLADDESDLVYHIACSRDRPDGAPEDGLARLSCLWFTTDEDSPRTEEMPRRYRKVLELTSEFSQDAKAHQDKIATEAWPLFDDDSAGMLPAGARDIDHVFRTADWLAIYFQKRFLWVLRSTHLLALLMGLMYIAYSDLLPLRVFILAFIIFFVLAAAVHKLGGRLSWHRKYLDYRTLAEGLRVQFYWAVAGVTSGNVSKFSHDNFLQMQDSDLGWIRNVMRVAGLECNVSPNNDPAGLEFSIREWIGDNSSGQLGYYRRKILEKIGRNRRTERFAAAVLWISAVAFALFVFASDDVADRVRDPIVVLMGILLLAVGVRQSYSFSVADFELLRIHVANLQQGASPHRAQQQRRGTAPDPAHRWRGGSRGARRVDPDAPRTLDQRG
jgi:hypothetical protein